jgi:hypothetical protein
MGPRPPGERWFAVRGNYTIGNQGLEVGSQPFSGFPANTKIPPGTFVSSDYSNWVGTPGSP